MRLSVTKDLTPLRAAAYERINVEAGEIRKRYITDAPGQEMSYQEKYAEALAYLANEEIDESEIPCITAEVGASGATKYEVAQVVVNLRAMWKVLNGLIEGARAHAKTSIDAAQSPAEIETASQIDWSATLAPQ